MDWWSLWLRPLCPLCDRPAQRDFCGDCLRQLTQGQGAIAPRGELLLAWGNYQGPLKRAIAQLKYEKQPRLGIALGRRLGERWRSSDWGKRRGVTVIPIPLHREKLKQRGFNQAERLARGFAEMTRFPVNTKALVRQKATAALFNLSPQDRQKEMQGAFTLAHPLGGPVLLLDDIYTTGTTVKTAAQTLRDRGVEVWGVIALAAAQPQGDRYNRISSMTSSL